MRNRIDIEAARQLEEARSLRRLRIDGKTPKLRVVLDKHRDLMCLQVLGVIRERDGCVQLWAADEALANETMQVLISEGERMQRVKADNCFQVVLENVPPFVFKWKSTLTLAGARVTNKYILHKPLTRVCFRIQLLLLAQVSVTFFVDSSPLTVAGCPSRILAEI